MQQNKIINNINSISVCSNNKFEVGISSIGGVGSSCLISFVSRFYVTNNNSFKEGSSVYKHSMKPPTRDKLPKTFKGKYIFVVGNIYNSILSLFDGEYTTDKKPRINHCHLINKGIKFDKELTQDEYFSKDKLINKNGPEDIYKVKEQLENWINCKKENHKETNIIDYDIMIVKYDNMFKEENIKKILKFLMIDEKLWCRFPKWKKRKNCITYEPHHKYYNEIIEMYSDAQKIVDSLDDITII